MGHLLTDISHFVSIWTILRPLLIWTNFPQTHPIEALHPDFGQIALYILQGKHTMPHAAGASDSTWSDMYIGTTFMQYRHSQGGLNAIIFHENTTQSWDLSLHTCSCLIGDLAAVRNHNLSHHFIIEKKCLGDYVGSLHNLLIPWIQKAITQSA